jgi:uncharacterized protein YfbU (UPF0304 family)
MMEWLNVINHRREFKMEFNNQQKLIISLLTDIHAKLAIQDSLDPDFVQRMVSSDHGWAIEWKYPGTFETTGEGDPEDVNYVSAVLEMWSVLEMSVKSLNQKQRKALTIAADPFGKDVKFPGFDGNNEGRYLGIARIFLNDLGLWSELDGRVPNSHGRTTSYYQRMLSVFATIRDGKFANNDYGFFNLDEIAEVLNSKRHP